MKIKSIFLFFPPFTFYVYLFIGRHVGEVKSTMIVIVLYFFCIFWGEKENNVLPRLRLTEAYPLRVIFLYLFDFDFINLIGQYGHRCIWYFMWLSLWTFHLCRSDWWSLDIDKSKLVIWWRSCIINGGSWDLERTYYESQLLWLLNFCMNVDVFVKWFSCECYFDFNCNHIWLFYLFLLVDLLKEGC